MRPIRLPSLIVLSVGVFACAHEEPRRAPLEIAEVSHELGAGDRGPEVAAVYDRLRQYGYLPNADLEQSYRYWAPVIDREAEDPAVFGPVHAAALRAFQRQAGLPESGQVDAQSLDVLKRPRCGHPENELALFDPREKWDLIEDQEVMRLLTSTTVSWFVTSCHDDGSNFCETLATNFNAGPSGNASSVERTAFVAKHAAARPPRAAVRRPERRGHGASHRARSSSAVRWRVGRAGVCASPQVTCPR